MTWQHSTSAVPAEGSHDKSSASRLGVLTSHLRVCLVLVCYIVDRQSVDKLVQLILSTFSSH